MNHFYIDSTGDFVKIWTNRLPPYEPQDWLEDFRNEIQNKIKSLSPAVDNYLYCKLVTNKNTKIDLDNVLFYNIAYSTFSFLSVDSLVMERVTSSPKTAPDRNDYDYLLYYTTKKTNLENQKRKILASFTSVPIQDYNSETKTARIWHSIKKGSMDIFEKCPYVQFGLNITIYSPDLRLISELGLKRIIDATVAAFQSHSAEDHETFERVSKSLGIAASEAKKLLCDSANSVIGSDVLVKPHGNGLKWNPRDDLALVVKLSMKHTEQNSLSIQGQIFSLG